MDPWAKAALQAVEKRQAETAAAAKDKQAAKAAAAQAKKAAQDAGHAKKEVKVKEQVHEVAKADN